MGMNIIIELPQWRQYKTFAIVVIEHTLRIFSLGDIDKIV